MGRIGRTDDIGQAVHYLICSSANYVNGQNLVVDGGLSDHMLAMIPGRPGKPAVKDLHESGLSLAIVWPARSHRLGHRVSKRHGLGHRQCTGARRCAGTDQ